MPTAIINVNSWYVYIEKERDDEIFRKTIETYVKYKKNKIIEYREEIKRSEHIGNIVFF